MTEAWLAHSADLAARFARTRPEDPVRSATDGYLLQAAAESIADTEHERPSWASLDVPRFLRALGGEESRTVRAAAAEALGAFYIWQVGEGELSVTAALPVLDALTSASGE